MPTESHVHRIVTTNRGPHLSRHFHFQCTCGHHTQPGPDRTTATQAQADHERAVGG